MTANGTEPHQNVPSWSASQSASTYSNHADRNMCSICPLWDTY